MCRLKISRKKCGMVVYGEDGEIIQLYLRHSVL